MNDAASKTGGVLYFEPLRTELHDCFRAIKNVQPDCVFSSRQGMIVHSPPDEGAETSNDTDTNETGSKEEQGKPERERKSMFSLHNNMSQKIDVNSAA